MNVKKLAGGCRTMRALDLAVYISYVTYVINETFIWDCDLVSCHVLLPCTV